MANNITSKFFTGATRGVIVTTTDITRVVGIHATAVTATFVFSLSEGGVDKIKFTVPASNTSDIYIGEMGIRFDGTISASMPADGASLTLIVG